MRFGYKFLKRTRGAVSILLVILMIPMFTFAGTIVDFSRMNSANTVLSGASDLAMNAALSDYDKTLKDVYGIFAMSGTSDELQENIERYFENTLTNATALDVDDDAYTQQFMQSIMSWFTTATASGTIPDDDDFDTLLQMITVEDDGFTAEYVTGSEVYQPSIIKRQILEYSKYRAPVSMSTSLLSKFKGFKGFSEQSKVLEKKVDYEEELDNAGDICQAAYDALISARDDEYSHSSISGNATLNDNDKTVKAAIENKFTSIKGNAESSYEKVSYYISGIQSMNALYNLDSWGSNCTKDTKSYNALETAVDDTTYDSDLNSDDNEDKDVYVFWKQLENIIKEADNFWGTPYFSDVDIEPSVTVSTDEDGVKSCSVELEYNELTSFDVNGKNTELTTAYNSLKSAMNTVNAQGDVVNKENVKQIVDAQIKFKNFTDTLIKYYTSYDKMGRLLSLYKYMSDYKTNHSDAWTKIIADGDCGTVIKKYFNYLSNLSSYCKLASTSAATLSAKRTKIIDEVNSISASVNNEFKSLQELVSAKKEDYSTALSKLDALKTEVTTLKDLGGEWEKAAGNVTDTGTKQTMLSDYESTAKNMNDDELQDLIDIVQQDYDYFEALLTSIQSFKYSGKCLYNTTGSTLYNTYTAVRKTPTVSASAENMIASCTEQIDSDSTNKLITAEITKTAFSELCTDSQLATTDEYTAASQQFFAYLYRLCKDGVESNDNQDSDEAGSKDAMIEEGQKAENGDSTDRETNAAGESLSKDLKSSVESVNDASTNVYNALFADSSDSTDISGSDSTKISGDDDKAKAKSAKDIKNSSSFLESLANIATSGRDALYINEYMTKMFSCYTTNLVDGDKSETDETTLSGFAINSTNNYFYGGECEYILWGGNPDSAVKKTKASIYGIRLILNTIYAFTDPIIQSTALEWAVAIAGWTGFGIPIVQTVITIGLAMAESALDLAELCKGNSVPIYKSQSTWVCSPEGALNKATEIGTELVEKAAETAKTYISEGITEITNKIADASMDKLDELNQVITDYTDTTVDQIASQAKAYTITPIKNKIKQLLTGAEDLTKDQMEKEINLVFTNLEANIDSETTLGQCETEILNILKENVSSIASDIETEMSKADAKNDEIWKNIEEKYFDSNAEKIKEAVSSKLNSYNESLKEKCKSIIEDKGDDVKEKLNEEIDKYSEQVTGKFKTSTDSSTGKETAEAGTDDNTISSALTLNYKEYLYAFMLIGQAVDQDGMLKRTAYLMQVNVTTMEDGDSSFDMTKAHTMVTVSSQADVGATFLGMYKQVTDSSGNTVTSIDFSADGQTTNRVKYNGVMGY